MAATRNRTYPGLPRNPYATYVLCDASMSYGAGARGGIGVHIEFPESMGLEALDFKFGSYRGANIEQLELQAIIFGLEAILDLVTKDSGLIRGIGHIVVVTDRQHLNDGDLTSRSRIAQWRHDGWLNFEGKAIKNQELLESLDKARGKVEKAARCTVEIQYQRRRQNRAADKLSREAKGLPSSPTSLEITRPKMAARRYDGPMVDYRVLSSGQALVVHIYRKDPAGQQWHIYAEIAEPSLLGQKLTIYSDSDLERTIHRRHFHRIVLQSVFRHHVTIEALLLDLGTSPPSSAG